MRANTYICMYVCTYICMYAYMYVRISMIRKYHERSETSFKRIHIIKLIEDNRDYNNHLTYVQSYACLYTLICAYLHTYIHKYILRTCTYRQRHVFIGICNFTYMHVCTYICT